MTGIAAAMALARAGVAVALLDAAAVPGGVIRTESRDGFLLEHGPDCFATNRPRGLGMARELGVEQEIVSTCTEARRAFVVSRRRLRPIPEGFHLLAPTSFLPFAFSPVLSPLGKLRVALDLLLPARPQADESLTSFVTRRLGREALERLAEPLVAGIHGADPARLSLAATFPEFMALEREHGSLILGLLRRRRAAARRNDPGAAAAGPRYGLLVSFRRGLGTLVDAMVARLPEDTFRPNTRVIGLHRQGERWRIEVAGEDVREVDGLVLALGAQTAAPLLQSALPDLAGRLGRIPYGSAVTVNLGFRRGDIGHPLDGAGFVVPAREVRCLKACTFASSKYPGRSPEGHVLVRAFVGGAVLPPVVAEDDDAVLAAVLEDLGGLLDLRGAPVLHSVTRYERAMAQYEVGHLDRVAELETEIARIPGLAVAGNALRGVGIPDCILSGEKAAERLLG